MCMALIANFFVVVRIPHGGNFAHHSRVSSHAFNPVYLLDCCWYRLYTHSHSDGGGCGLSPPTWIVMWWCIAWHSSIYKRKATQMTDGGWHDLFDMQYAFRYILYLWCCPCPCAIPSSCHECLMIIVACNMCFYVWGNTPSSQLIWLLTCSILVYL